MVIDPDRDSPLTQFSTREQALSAATLALEEVRGGRLEIADENGVRELDPVPVVRRPWWQATKTPRAGLLLGLLWLGLFILRLTTDGRPGWHLESLLLVLSGGLAALYLSTSVALTPTATVSEGVGEQLKIRTLARRGNSFASDDVPFLLRAR